MRMLQRGSQLAFAAEALGVYAGRHLRGQDLHHHRPPQRTLLCEEDATHPAAAELLVDVVGVAEDTLQARLEIDHTATRSRGTTPS